MQDNYEPGLRTDEPIPTKVEKRLPLMEMFGPTIQGEGTVIGQQTYFLRFGLCDYKCTMCDSMHAVDPRSVKAHAQYLTQAEIFEAFWEYRKPDTTDWLTFSGGNPAIHDLSELVGLCKMNQIKINVETQGTRWQGWMGKVDSLTISPKGPGMGETHNQEVFMGFMEKLSESKKDIFSEAALNGLPQLCIKIVVFDQRDLEFAKDIFLSLRDMEMFQILDLSNTFYLSLGNTNPPPLAGEDPGFNIEDALVRYKMLFEDIKNDPILSKVRFLPQWHALVWGNEKGF
jgi:7-carboxy-7-deazaguanine synthase